MTISIADGEFPGKNTEKCWLTRPSRPPRSRFGGGIYALTGPDDELSALDYAALSEVRLAVEHCMEGHAAAAVVTLAAPAVYAQPGQPPKFTRLCADHQCDHKTMLCPDNRTHTLGHHRQHPHVHDAASALARKAVLARQR